MGHPEALRIAHVFRAPLGGLFRHVVDLAVEQAEQGHLVGMFFDSTGDCDRVQNALKRVPRGLALGVETTPIVRNPSPVDLATLHRFTTWLQTARPDVVHGHGSKGGVYARMSRYAGGGDAIRAYTPHGGSFNFKPGSLSHRLYMSAERALAYSTDVFLFESAYIAGRYDEFVGVQTGLRRIVPNGLSAAEFEPVAPRPNAADIVYVGELRAAKGIDTLLNAMPLIASRLGRAPTAVLVGSGPDRDELRDLARRLGLTAQVTFPGPRPARQAFGLARTLVVPSRAESMPYVVLEAAAARMPLIATNVGGIPEIFGPFRDRLGPSDDPENLADRILAKLQAKPEETLREAEALRQYVAKTFSLRHMVDAVVGGYHEALSRRRPRRDALASTAQPAS